MTFAVRQIVSAPPISVVSISSNKQSSGFNLCSVSQPLFFGGGLMYSSFCPILKYISMFTRYSALVLRLRSCKIQYTLHMHWC